MHEMVAGYLRDYSETSPSDRQADFDGVMKLITRFRPVPPGTRLLEIGTGTGWFQILCRQHGIEASGLDVDADLVRSAIEFGKRCGMDLDVQVASIEAADIGIARYDVIVANSTFEHVKNWQGGLAKVFAALKPGGVLFFCSPNKFSFRSTEFWIPLYGWLPDRCRYALRKRLQGEGIMEWGIDFNQFTYPQLRRFFKRLGFSKTFDLVDALDPDSLNNPTLTKKLFLKALSTFKILKHPVLMFSNNALFICTK